ncbi:hypothetical protein [Nocardiopsis halophila]|uniref:hypothetical protein n=1 Tax=Nocardiopsis halophila TaxID=141692 RepID=UPI0003483E1F|nr:hypothetical protein [Nocardiopsis halophila]
MSARGDGAPELRVPDGEPVYSREGGFAVFNQLGVKLDFPESVSDTDYYAWLDDTKAAIGSLVEGAEIAEKSYARTEPRMNTGVYYDTADHRLLRGDMVLRTTCNIKTHAFCAFKFGADEHGVRRDHRYSFEGQDKRTVQLQPDSPEAAAVVQRLLAREDIDQPGVHLRKATGLTGDDLFPAIRLRQFRHPFFVWVDGRDALRCTMDRARVVDLRAPDPEATEASFSEVEFPVYPRLDADMARDPRVPRLIRVLSDLLQERFGVDYVADSKYRRAARALGMAWT